MLIDTHTHLNFNAYRVDFEEVIKRTLEGDVWMINIGTQYDTSKKAIEIAENYGKGVYAAIGLHPLHLESRKMDALEIGSQIGGVKTRAEEFDYQKYKELAKSKKVIAIGEIGLDYYYKPKTKIKLNLFKQKQKELLLKQLKLAKELNLPVIFHCRMAHQDLIQFLKENKAIKPKNAVAHGFVGNSEELEEYLDFGFHIGFNGIIFKNIEGIDFRENIRKTPLDKILVETDCPYLTPPQAEGQRNEPLFVKYVAEMIAKIKNLSYEEVANTTTKNARKLFEI